MTCYDEYTLDGSHLSWTDRSKGMNIDHFPKDGEIQDYSDYSYYVVKLLHGMGKDKNPEIWNQIQRENEYYAMLQNAVHELVGDYTSEANECISMTVSEDKMEISTKGTYTLSANEIGDCLDIQLDDMIIKYDIDTGEGGSLILERNGEDIPLTLSEGEDGLNLKQTKAFEGRYSTMDGTGSYLMFYEDGTIEIVLGGNFGVDGAGNITIENFCVDGAGNITVAKDVEGSVTYAYTLKDNILTLQDENGNVQGIWKKQS